MGPRALTLLLILGSIVLTLVIGFATDWRFIFFALPLMFAFPLFGKGRRRD